MNEQYNTKLNLLEMLNARLRHVQQSTASTNIEKLPTVHHGHINDGIHDLTYGYANTNRAFHELVSNAGKAITNINRKSKLGNMSDYITASDDLSTNKLVIGQNGTISDSQYLRFTDITTGIITENIGTILGIYAIDENNCALVTKTKIYSYNAITHNVTTLADIQFNNSNTIIISTKYISEEVFQVVTNSDIRHYKMSIDVDSNELTLRNVLHIRINDKYSDDKLVVIDVVRKQSIIETIFKQFTTVTEISKSLLWFDDFIPFTTSLLAEAPSTSTTVAMQCLGILTGEFGIYELIQHSNGYYFVRVIDNEPIKKSISYTKNGTTWIIVFNTIGVKTYKCISDGVSVFNTLTTDPDLLTWNWLPETGNVETFSGSNQYVNVNPVLEYGVTPTLDANAAYSEHIPGAAIGDIMYAYYTSDAGQLRIALRDTKITVGNNIRCTFDPTTAGLTRLIHDYDLYEFNSLKEVTVSDIVNYSDTHFLFSIKNVGLIQGEITYDANSLAGMRLSNIQKYSAVANNDVNFLPAGKCIFIFNKTNNVLYASASDADSLLQLNASILGKPKAITRIINDYVFIVSDGVLGGPDQIFKSKLVRHYTNTVNDLSTTILGLITENSDGVLNTLFKAHIDTLHTDDSAMTRFNKFIYELKNAATNDSTVYVADSGIAYISTGYGLKNVERVVTDKNSTHIYGRIKSKTVNANSQLTTETRRSTDSILFYDTIIDSSGIETSTNKLSYIAYRLADNIVKIDVDIPTTGTYYVNNILGWSKGANSGSTLMRPNLNDGYISGKLENAITEFQLVLNREYFGIKRIINANCQLASAPLGIYSDKKYIDALHYGMFDSPVITPLCTTKLLSDNTFEMLNNQNNEVIISFCIFGGDALTISVLIETD